MENCQKAYNIRWRWGIVNKATIYDNDEWLLIRPRTYDDDIIVNKATIYYDDEW